MRSRTAGPFTGPDFIDQVFRGPVSILRSVQAPEERLAPIQAAIPAQTPAPTVEAATCVRCGRNARHRWGFAFDNRAGGSVMKCARCAYRHWPMLRRSILTAVVVGTIITALNQGNVIVAGNWVNELFWKIPLSYMVPFSVATYIALSNARR